MLLLALLELLTEQYINDYESQLPSETQFVQIRINSGVVTISKTVRPLSTDMEL